MFVVSQMFANVSRLSAVVLLKDTKYFLKVQLRLGGDVCCPVRATHVIGVAARRCGVSPIGITPHRVRVWFVAWFIT